MSLWESVMELEEALKQSERDCVAAEARVEDLCLRVQKLEVEAKWALEGQSNAREAIASRDKEIAFLRDVKDGYRKELKKFKRLVDSWVFVGDEGEEGC